MGMTEGLITKWHKSVGDSIQEGESFCDIETAKSVVEMQVPFSGTLTKVLVPVDRSVSVGTCIALVDDGAGGAMVDSGAKDEERRPHAVPSSVSTASTAVAVQVEPRARNVARAHNVNLAGVKGSGPGGRIIEQDVLAVVAQSAGKSPGQPS